MIFNFLKNKKIYHFNSEKTEGRKTDKLLLGGKGANLCEMTHLKIPVPPGFVISTKVCQDFYEKKLKNSFFNEVFDAVKKLEKILNKKFGDEKNPLLLSVRSGAPVSMPGMMDSILNLGLNEKTTKALAKISHNEQFAWDSYRRFIQMYSEVVLGMNYSILETYLEDLKQDKNYKQDSDIKTEDLKKLTSFFKEEIFRSTGKTFPDDPKEQLKQAILAVFKSFKNPRAITYRKLNGISEKLGTAVSIQSMVFGNLDENSATGVCFTRNPSNGKKEFFGEYLMKAQGEDVVSGMRTPVGIKEIDSGLDSLEKKMPNVYKDLVRIGEKLEKHYKDMQDIEFTVEKGKLWILQTRTAKRSAQASLKIALSLLDEKIINEKQALLQIDPESLNQLLHPSLDFKDHKALSKGLPASPGAVSAKIALSKEAVLKHKQENDESILVRLETSPEDIEAMLDAKGILTAKGGMTSHAAVVARGMGKSCVASCMGLEIFEKQKKIKIQGEEFLEGDYLSLDGSTGNIFKGKLEARKPEMNEDFKRLLKIADSYRKVAIRVNADHIKDAKLAFSFGAEGVGLCRTEHMFFGKKRIFLMRQMILSDSLEKRMQYLNELKQFQKSDFISFFKGLEKRPITIRLLDPPLHEFLPQNQKEIKELCESFKLSEDELKQRIKSLSELNPMLGHRGSRLAISYPEIYKMQIEAICEALFESKTKALLEIMLPLISYEKEFTYLKKKIQSQIKAFQDKKKFKFSYDIGTMIELPRACLIADEIAKHADFFSFGTNDLTQTSLGLSRDDSSVFLEDYMKSQIFEKDPFMSLDQRGVGKLIKIAIKLGKKTKSDIKLGICGEHGGDPLSLAFFSENNFNYVSCSPYRVPIAKLALAQASFKRKK